jgi:hypothetical protein
MNKGRSFTSFWDVSDITLVMSNSHIVRMLMQRGTYIKNKNFKGRDEMNKKITEFVHS